MFKQKFNQSVIHTFKSFSFCYSDHVYHFIFRKYIVDGNFFLKQSARIVDLIEYGYQY